MARTKYPLLALLFLLLSTIPALAQGPPCRPCAGVRVDDPLAAAAAIDAVSDFAERRPLYVAWDVELGTAGAAGVEDVVAATRALREVGATPWLRLVFTSRPPLAAAGDGLEGELGTTAELARRAAPDTHFQIVWRPGGEDLAGSGGPAAAEYAYLVKRAAVAVTGARPAARVISAPWPAAAGAVEALYAEEVAAYLDGLALAPPAGAAAGVDALPLALEGALGALAEADPGRTVVLDALPLPEAPELALLDAARQVASGVGLTFFRLPAATPEALEPFAILAAELGGDLSFDPASAPAGAEEAYVFVRGEDLSARVIVRLPEGEGEVELAFPDPTLRGPERVTSARGDTSPLFGVGRSAEGLTVPVPAAGSRAAVLRLDRGAVGDLGEVAEELTVEDERSMPVEEILRRLQGFEDAQARRLGHYRATNTTHLRFGAGAGIQSVEVTLQGPFFFRRGEGFDWAWRTFFVNGVRWRGKRIPEIPLIQPEKAAALPLEITFTRQYVYELVGTETVDGRDAWVIDFRPAPGADAEGENLYRGRVWVDRELYARLRTRAVQLGLEGEVLSNEETLFYRPIDAAGKPAAWSAESYVLPLRSTGQQLVSVVNSNTLVERETLLSEVEIDGAGFEAERRAVEASEATMVRDTDAGLRYLVKEEGSDERVVQEGFDTNRLFAVGGVFYDDALDYPLPLAGVNYLDFDFRGTGRQLNVFFGGALLVANLAEPRVADRRVDVGGQVFAIAVPLTDNLYRDGREVPGEEVESRPASVALKAGRLFGEFLKVNTEYQLFHFDFGTSDDTADEFVVPADHFLHSLSLSGSYTRRGYRLAAGASYNSRSEWRPWGLPGADVYDPEHEDFVRWRAALAKSWFLPRFQKIGAELVHVGGQDLDRFSKYGFGYFGDTRVHGYQSNRVRAEEASLAHLSYGFEIGEALRIEAVGDVAWATDEAAGLSNELLAGVGLVGTFLGPWETVVNLDFGVPVEGPDDGFVVYLAFLKLFGR